MKKMPEQTKPRYKICTTNCLNHGYHGADTCRKANWSFTSPIGKRCSFSLLEGECEPVYFGTDVEHTSGFEAHTSLPEQLREQIEGVH